MADFSASSRRAIGRRPIGCSTGYVVNPPSELVCGGARKGSRLVGGGTNACSRASGRPATGTLPRAVPNSSLAQNTPGPLEFLALRVIQILFLERLIDDRNKTTRLSAERHQHLNCVPTVVRLTKLDQGKPQIL